MSFASSLRKLLPSNRPEKGHTIRTGRNNLSESRQDDAHTIEKQGSPGSDPGGESADRIVRWNTAIEPSPSSNSTPSTRTQQLYLAHREKRRLRRSLRESGDYLGVQGINPATGELDVLTPTSSSASEFASLAQTVANKRSAYEAARRQLQAEKMRKWERDKEAIRAEHRNTVRWMKRRSGWSSAIEPALSPIAQSSAATTPRDGESTGTVVRTPSVRHASEDDPGQTRTTGSTRGQSLTSGATGGLRRKPVPLSAAARALSSKRSYSDLIPVESEFPAVRVVVEDLRSPEIHLGDDLVDQEMSTPESDLDPSKPDSMTHEYYTDQRGSKKSEPRGRATRPTNSRTSESRTSSSALERRDAGRNVGGDGITSGESSCNEALKNTGGKICLHTHHHHYWILSDSVALQSMPNLRSSRQRAPLQKADENCRLAAFPDESDVEGLAEARRPPSRNTNRRYFIDG
ncbi:hypothetical protein INS49_000545 [Diaporthe citri]|uniref:uncharacterized protein n=1 Tax=Diaporthe citri TaxID=83186 RepID=UPI001C7F5E0D|nr:uncharacterized protein INS49_000545 [Diaporthe citri]KAG6366368.1 hypothetical protein INS49_000545 [Diaporthe citri]